MSNTLSASDARDVASLEGDRSMHHHVGENADARGSDFDAESGEHPAVRRLSQIHQEMPADASPSPSGS